MTEIGNMTDECLEFTVFCIESVAERLQTTGDIVYEMMTKRSDVLDNYIIPEYEVLHTQGKDYIVDELMDVMAEQGALV